MGNEVLRVEDADIYVAGKRILRKVNLSVGAGELHIVMGPNASGKTTLLSAIAGVEPYEVRSGKVMLAGEDITNYPLHERVEKGLVLAYQNPPSFKGVKVSEILKWLRRKFDLDPSFTESLAEILDIHKLLGRDLFSGMSGGERKRLETYLTLSIMPKVALLDEPDSGVDLDSVGRILEAIKLALKHGVSVVLVTHSTHMLNLVRPLTNTVHLIFKGHLVFSGLYDEVVPLVIKRGFEGAAKALGRWS